MFRKLVTMLIAILLCCTALLSCSNVNNIPNHSKETVVPSKSDEIQPLDSCNNINFEGCIISNIENIIKLDEDDYSGVMIKEISSEKSSDIYITEKQLNDIKIKYIEDSYNLPYLSEEEVCDQHIIVQLGTLIAENNEYYTSSNADIDKVLKFKSDRKEISDYAYQYYILDLDYYGIIIYYTIYKKIDNKWEYFMDWAFSQDNVNISKEEFLKKEIIFNTKKDDISYFSNLYLSGNNPQYTYMYLNNGQTGYITYTDIYDTQNDNTYCLCNKIILYKFNLFDILQEGDEPEEVLKRFNEQAEQ